MIAPAPLLLVLVGTLLMAVVIFAPQPEPRAQPAAVVTIAEPAWPMLVDPRAHGCDVATRLALADALAAARCEWAAGIVARAVDDEPDPRVRAALARARRSG